MVSVEQTRTATEPRLRTLVLDRPELPAPAPAITPACRPRAAATRRGGSGRPRCRRVYACRGH
jgi:hypothetical protein